MEKNEKKNKHMTLEDRVEIQECLQKGMTFKAIAYRIGKDPTTVSKEARLHAATHTNSFVKTDEICPKLLRAPFVCNGCGKRNHSNCLYARRIYTAKTAQQEYKTVLVESRDGIPLNKETFYANEKIIRTRFVPVSISIRRSGRTIFPCQRLRYTGISRKGTIPSPKSISPERLNSNRAVEPVRSPFRRESGSAGRMKTISLSLIDIRPSTPWRWIPSSAGSAEKSS